MSAALIPPVAAPGCMLELFPGLREFSGSMLMNCRQAGLGDRPTLEDILASHFAL